MQLFSEVKTYEAGSKKRRMIVLRPKDAAGPVPGILWIHGGGYALGMASMVYASCGKMLAKHFGAVVVSPAYRLSWREPYPAAFEDCYGALVWMYRHAAELEIDPERIVVGGESAGGGLAAAVCLRARDTGEVPVAMQIPLYPMLDCRDTETSRDNHGFVWNTRRNHWGWKMYLGKLWGSEEVPVYASPAGAEDLTGMPPLFTFVADGEPFYAETLAYAEKLHACGVETETWVWPGRTHAFDLMLPWTGKARGARRALREAYLRRIGRGESGVPGSKSKDSIKCAK